MFAEQKRTKSCFMFNKLYQSMNQVTYFWDQSCEAPATKREKINLRSACRIKRTRKIKMRKKTKVVTRLSDNKRSYHLLKKIHLSRSVCVI